MFDPNLLWEKVRALLWIVEIVTSFCIGVVFFGGVLDLLYIYFYNLNYGCV